jgi:lysophospholipase L1-like esterase
MNVLLVGDSQAAGPPGRAAERALVAQGHSVTRVGHVGHGAADWVRLHGAQYAELLDTTRPDAVVLMFGSNDPANLALEEALRFFQHSAPVVYYTGPPRYPDRPNVHVSAAAIRYMAQGVFGARYIDAWPHTGPEAARARDGLHFTREGGEAWGQAVAQRLGGSRWLGPVVLGSLAVVGLGLGVWWARRRRGLRGLGLLAPEHERIYLKKLRESEASLRLFKRAERCDVMRTHGNEYVKLASAAIAHAGSDPDFRAQVTRVRDRAVPASSIVDQNKLLVVKELTREITQVQRRLGKACGRSKRKLS